MTASSLKNIHVNVFGDIKNTRKQINNINRSLELESI